MSLFSGSGCPPCPPTMGWGVPMSSLGRSGCLLCPPTMGRGVPMSPFSGSVSPPCPLTMDQGVPVSPLSRSGCPRVPTLPMQSSFREHASHPWGLCPAWPYLLLSPQVCCPSATSRRHGAELPGSPPASRSPRAVPSATTRSWWSWTRAQVRQVAPLRCHPQPTGQCGAQAGPLQCLPHGTCGPGRGKPPEPQMFHLQLLRTLRSVWVWESHQSWVLQVAGCCLGASGKPQLSPWADLVTRPLPMPRPLCGVPALGTW